jgi:hypothetical protein
MRVGFCGASGTGKTTLAEHIRDKYGVPMTPVGSRSVSRAMGFASPYEVDAAGKRAEFQRRFLREKLAWEAEHDSFVTDRSTLDLIAYWSMHDVASVEADDLAMAVLGVRRLTHLFYCPYDAFHDLKSDPARIQSHTYHRVFDVFAEGLARRHRNRDSLVVLHQADLAWRRETVEGALDAAPWGS